MGENLSPGLATQLLMGTGIQRNPPDSGGILQILEESGVNTGIFVPQKFLQKNTVKATENRNSYNPLQNHVPVKNSSRNHKKKEILRNLVRNGFLGPKNKFLKTGTVYLGADNNTISNNPFLFLFLSQMHQQLV